MTGTRRYLFILYCLCISSQVRFVFESLLRMSTWILWPSVYKSFDKNVWICSSLRKFFWSIKNLYRPFNLYFSTILKNNLHGGHRHPGFFSMYALKTMWNTFSVCVSLAPSRAPLKLCVLHSIVFHILLRACEIPRSVSKIVNNFFHNCLH